MHRTHYFKGDIKYSQETQAQAAFLQHYCIGSGKAISVPNDHV